MKRRYILTLILAVFTYAGMAQTGLKTRIIKDSLFIPWEMVWGPDDNIWFTQKNGYICRLNPATSRLDTLYHETATVIQNEGGMLGMALHPQFPASPYVYVAYDYNSGSGYRERIVRYTYNGSNALTSPLTILDNIGAASIHNGCRLLIVGDKLFITTGDANATSTSQNISSLNGKVLRLNLDGSIPADNPIAGSGVWSWGHRNAQGLAYANGLLYSSEQGPGSDDELNIIRRGRNYGWPDVQGFCDKAAETQFCADSNVAQPLIAWTPTLAVSGIEYYTGSMFPAWQGSLLMTTLKDSKLYALKLNGAKDSVVSAAAIPGVAFGRLRDICISPSGRVYISTSNAPASGSGAKTDKIIELYDSAAAAGLTAFSRPLAMNIFPNPVSNVLNATYEGGEALFRIIAPDGRIVQEGKADAGTLNLPVDKLPAGMYMLRLQSVRDDRVAISPFIRK